VEVGDAAKPCRAGRLVEGPGLCYRWRFGARLEADPRAIGAPCLRRSEIETACFVDDGSWPGVQAQSQTRRRGEGALSSPGEWLATRRFVDGQACAEMTRGCSRGWGRGRGRCEKNARLRARGQEGKRAWAKKRCWRGEDAGERDRDRDSKGAGAAGSACGCQYPTTGG
jgi:hypothetical protein